ncbi:hypothetical protein GBAR_LOCUS22647 [Geodia barretti]|nr:hypothetical protein GBAR_LOCUS22647 [Geodia barretti]
MGATLHLNSSLNQDPTKNETTPLVTVSVCLFGFCYDERVASLDSFSSTTGLHTVSVTGLLSLTENDRLVVLVKTNSVTTAAILKHSSFMGFLWGRSRSK